MKRASPTARTRLLAALALALGTSLGAGCQETLIQTPYLMYGQKGREVFAHAPSTLKTPDLPVLYVTDRMPDATGENGPKYGYGRSKRMEFGVATCSLGADVTWDELVADSTGPERKHSYSPRVVKVEKTGQFEPVMTRCEVVNGRIVARKDGLEAIYAEQEQLNKTLARWLDHSDRKEALIFIHGFNNTFDDGVLRLAQAWHFSGRQGVPIVFTWPAGSPGLFGYTHDRESGEFANMHLKILLVSLAKCPQIERIHIISHSRGTDVATTALRELHDEIRAGLGRSIFCGMLGLGPTDGTPSAPATDPRLTCDVLKLETLVLAAPDLDLEVFTQRFVGDNVLNAARSTVIYFSEHDEALDWSNWLFSGKRRVGNFRVTDISPEQAAIMQNLTTLELINCNVSGGSSHSYVMQHPAALSDLIMVVDDRLKPGAENGRPLTQTSKPFWTLDNDYMRPNSTKAAE